MRRFHVLSALLALVLCSMAAHAALITPTKLSELDMYPWGSTQPFACSVLKNWVYVTTSVAANGSDPNILAVDISNPAAPSVTAEGVYYSAHGEDCDISDGKLYAALWGSGVFVVDTHNNGSVDYRSYEWMGGHVWRIKVVGNRAYVMGDDGLYVLDVTNPLDPTKLGSYKLLTYPWAVGVRDNIVYCGDDHKVVALDCSDPTNITQTAQVNCGAYVNRIEPQGDYLYVGTADGTASTFTVLDITQPWNPKRIQVGGVNVGQISGEVGCSDMWMAGNIVFMAVSNGLLRMDVTNPLAPKVKSPLLGATGGGLSISCNGRYAYTTGITSSNIHGWLTTWQIYDADPDNAAPAVWRKFSVTDAGWDAQLHGDALPTAAAPAWQWTSGSEAYASVADGALRINDNSTSTGSKVLWTRQWGAANWKGTTTLFRARCASQSGTGPGNLIIRDGRYTGTFSLRPDSFRVINTGQSFSLDGSNWHTYRITTKTNTFKVYLDEGRVPVVTGTLSALAAPNLYHNEVSIGMDSDTGTQDLYIDWLYTSVEGEFAPSTGVIQLTPNVSIDIYDQRGTGSLSGIDISTAQAFFSVDGGATWTATPITVTGADMDERVTLTAPAVPFNQVSTDQNKIKFTISDTNGNSATSPVFNVRTLVDITPPGPVTNFTAVAGPTSVALNWTNPATSDFRGARIVYKTTGYPTGPFDGTLVVDQQAAPGSNGSYTHSISIGGATCYYSAYSYDQVANYSTTPAQAIAYLGTTALNVKPAAVSSITVDGNTSDWNLAEFTMCARGGQAYAGDYALVGYDGGSLYYAAYVYALPTSAADHTAKVYSRHDATYLYFLIRCDDSQMNYGSGVSSNWANDCVEFYIDPSHNHGSSTMSSSTSDIQLVIDCNNQSNVYMTTSGYKTQVLAGVTSAAVRDGTGWWLEARILKTALDPDLPTNGSFGIDFCFRDNDDNNSASTTTVYTWADRSSGGGFPSKIPNNWGDGNVPNLYPGAPSGVTVAPYTGSLSKLSCSWIAGAGSTNQRYAIGTTPGGATIAGWTDTTDTQVTRSGLSLTENATYYFSVKSGNDLNYWSSAVNSGGVTAAPAISIPAAKALPDGSPADVKALRGKAVSAVFADCFYVQEIGGWFGIKVTPLAAVSIGWEVDLAGRILGMGAERWFDWSGNAIEMSPPGP